MKVTKVSRQDKKNINIRDPINIIPFRMKMLTFVDIVEETVWQSEDRREIISPEDRILKSYVKIK